MDKNRPLLTVEEIDQNQTALLIGEETPFIADILKKRLENAGCRVDTKPHEKEQYDYLIYFGLPKLRKKHTRMSPKNLTGIRRVKPDGKVLIIATEDKVPDLDAIPFPVFAIVATRTFSADALGDIILKRLFYGKPLRELIDLPGDKHKPSVKFTLPLRELFRARTLPQMAAQIRMPRLSAIRFRKPSWAFLLISVFIILLISPLVIFGGSASYGAYQLSRATDFNRPIEDRASHLDRAREPVLFLNVITQKSAPALKSAMPAIAEPIDRINTLMINLYHAVEKGLLLEKMVQNARPSILGSGSFLRNSYGNIRDTSRIIEGHLTAAADAASYIQRWNGVPMIPAVHNRLTAVSDAAKQAKKINEVLPLVPSILSFEGEKRYVILLQNNFELRPTGGFIGSFAIVTLSGGAVTSVSVQDVYEADGQLKGAVEPPEPIRTYLGKTSWFLRDSNWHPDFPASAEQAAWFLKKEIDESYDGVLAVDLYFMQNLLHALGGVYVPDYQATVTADDFFIKLQSDTHEAFFPGSTKKRDLLAALADALLIRITEGNELNPPALADAFVRSLDEKHLLMYLNDKKAQAYIEQHEWDGGIIAMPTASEPADMPVQHDYFMLVEANVGVNKVNYYIDREVVSTVTVMPDRLQRDTLIYYKNRSPLRKTTFSGAYANYLRILVSDQTQDFRVTANDIPVEGFTIESLSGKRSHGFLVTAEPQDETRIHVSYRLPVPAADEFRYSYLVQKQPGTDHDPFVFKVEPSPSVEIIKNNIPSLPYLADLSVNRLITVDFRKQSK